MADLRGWLREEARSERAQPSIEAALLGYSSYAYAWRRLRFFSLQHVLVFAVNLVEYLFLSEIFDQENLVRAILLRNAVAVASSFWWGALEPLRVRIRELSARREHSRIHREISAWMTLGLALSVAVSATAAIWLAWSYFFRTGAFTVFQFYVLAVVARLVIDLPVRALHAGISAMRRIYRPAVLFVLIELAGLGLTVALWKYADYWAFPLTSLASTLAAGAVSVIYIARAYGRIRLPLPSRMRLATARRIAADACGALGALFPGAAYALGRLGSMSVLVGAALSGGNARSGLVLVMHLAAPAVGAAADWAQVFYLDFARHSERIFERLRGRLLRLMVSTSAVVGAASWAVVAATLLWLAPGTLGVAGALALLPVFLLRSSLALFQVRRYAEGRYGMACFLALPQVLAWLVCGGAFRRGNPWEGLAAVAALYAAIWLISLRRKPVDTGKAALSLAELVWGAGRERREGCVVAVARFSAEPVGMRSWRLARDILGRLPFPAKVAPLGGRTALFVVSSVVSEGELRAEMAKASAGLVAGLTYARVKPGASGEELLAAACAPLFAGMEVEAAPDLDRRFASEFPSGLWLALDGSHGLKGIEEGDLRAIFKDAARFSSGEPGLPGRTVAYDVSSYYPGGIIERIYLVPKAEPIERRVRWKERVRVASLAASAISTLDRV